VGRDLTADSDHNLWETWRHIGHQAPGGHVEEDDDVVIVETGSSLPTFNPVFVRNVPGASVADAAALVRRAIDRTVPVIITVNPSVPDVERLVAAAISTGLVTRGPLPGMALDALPARTLDKHTPRGLRIERLDPGDAPAWQSYFDVLCAGFEVAHELVAPLADRAIYTGPHIAAFLGRVRGRAVTTSLAFVTDDVAGVYNVATLPRYRRRGFGEAMTWAAVAWAKERGADVAVLQASDMGRPVYERMGFVQVVPYLQMVVPA
jgi:GNAT superfamily N-acetyltransferase